MLSSLTSKKIRDKIIFYLSAWRVIIYKVRSSLLRQAWLNPVLCDKMIHDNYQVVESAAMTKGSLLHLAVLEPEKFDKSYVIKEKGKGREFSFYHGKYQLLQSTVDELHAVAAEFYRYEELASSVLNAKHVELDIECEYDKDFILTAKPDLITEDNVLVDYKTVNEGRFHANWFYQATAHGYDLQFAHYHTVLEKSDIEVHGWRQIIQSTAYPYNIRIVNFGADFCEKSLQKWNETMTVFREIYHGKFEFKIPVETIDLPAAPIISSGADCDPELLDALAEYI